MKKILIVEDDHYSFLLLKNFLKLFNLTVIWAKNGFEALEACRTNSDFDLVFMDIALPDRSGYQLTKEIKKMYPHLVIVAETAHALYGDREKCLRAGCDEYISKPIQKEKFYQLLNNMGIVESDLQLSNT